MKERPSNGSATTAGMKGKMGSRRGYHHGDLKRALIEAAMTALETRGWHELSLRDVARQAGVSHAAPYRHIPSKEALLAVLAEVGYIMLADAMEASAGESPGDPVEQLRGASRAYVTFALERPALFRLMFSGATCDLSGGDLRPTTASRTFQLLVTLIAEGQASGSLRPGPPEDAATCAWSLLHGASLLLLERQLHIIGGGGGGPRKIDPMEIVDRATLQLLSGLGATSAARPPRHKSGRSN